MAIDEPASPRCIARKAVTKSNKELPRRKKESQMRNLSGGRGGRAITIGVRPGMGVLNNTKSEYEIASGYSTVANGYAARIAIQPGEVAVLNSGGGARDFARWSIGEPPEFQGIQVRPLTEILTLA